jgi:hypothetical protein
VNNKKILIILLSLFTTLSGQWTDFELDNASPTEFKKQVEPLLRGTALALAFSPGFDNLLDNRLKLGLLYTHGTLIEKIEFASGHLKTLPFIQAGVVVTSNILINGKFGSFRSKNDIVMVTSYGFNLRISNKGENNWFLDTQFALLSGPEDVRMRATSAQIKKKYDFSNLALCGGGGINIYKARIEISDQEDLPDKIENQTNYVLLGSSYQWRSIQFNVTGQFHQELMNLTFAISRSLR